MEKSILIWGSNLKGFDSTLGMHNFRPLNKDSNKLEGIPGQSEINACTWSGTQSQEDQEQSIGGETN